MLIVVSIYGCDLFQEDLIPDDQVVQVEQKEFYTLPNSPVVIDVASVVSSFEDVDVVVEGEPSRGVLHKLEGTLYKYAPGANFSEGRDYFRVNVSQRGRPLRTDSVCVVITRDTTIFPCRLQAVEDHVATVNTTVSVSFLANDRLCGINKNSLKKQIIIAPGHGVASITSNNLIQYTPEQGFEGEDFLVYKIAANRDRSFGLVRITVSADSCAPVLADDQVFISHANAQSPVDFSVIANDYLCGADSTGSTIQLLGIPVYGTITELSFGYFRYHFNQSVGTEFIDTVRYRICVDGNCDEATITFSFDNSCTTQAVDDDIYFGDSTLQQSVNLYVLMNDVLCDSLQTSLSIVDGPYHGSATAMLYYLNYAPDSLMGYDSLRYRICSSDSACSEATVRISRQ